PLRGALAPGRAEPPRLLRDGDRRPEEVRGLPPLRAVLWLVGDLHRPAAGDAQAQGLPGRDPHPEEGEGPPAGRLLARTIIEHAETAPHGAVLLPARRGPTAARPHRRRYARPAARCGSRAR